MRSIGLAILLVLFACDDEGRDACRHNGTSYAIGDVFPAGDGCNSCTCTPDGAACTLQACADAGVEPSPGLCGATGGCPEGPVCGARCCGRGERCEDGSCRCGPASACGDGDACEAYGPVGADRCGALCCGDSTRCPQ